MIFEYEKIENDTTLVKGMKLSCISQLQGLMSVFPYYCMVLFIVFPHLRLTHLKSSTLLMIFYPYQRHISPEFDFTFCDFSNMSATTFIEPLPVM